MEPNLFDRLQECAESRIPASEAVWKNWRAVRLSEENKRQALRILPLQEMVN